MQVCYPWVIKILLRCNSELDNGKTNIIRDHNISIIQTQACLFGEGGQILSHIKNVGTFQCEEHVAHALSVTAAACM